jgi:hypothetical protein
MKLKLRPFDLLLEALCLLLILATSLYCYHIYPSLPPQIPVHWSGPEPDRFGSRNFIWLGPAIGLVVYFLISFLQRRPRLYNVPVKIDTHKKYQFMYRCTNGIKLVVMPVILFMPFQSAGWVSGGRVTQMLYILLFTLAGGYGIIIYSMFKLTRMSDDEKRDLNIKPE